MAQGNMDGGGIMLQDLWWNACIYNFYEISHWAKNLRSPELLNLIILVGKRFIIAVLDWVSRDMNSNSQLYSVNASIFCALLPKSSMGF